MTPSPLFTALALVLFFFLPGYFLMKVLWPEWRLKGREGIERGVTIVAGALVSSTAMTILVGFVLGNTSSFQAGQSDPILEEVLGALSVAFFLTGLWRGAYSRVAPPASSYSETAMQGEDDTEKFVEEMETLVREEVRLRGEIKRAKRDDPAEAKRLKVELDARVARRRDLERARETKLTS
jgi:hypothetical protein